MQALPHSATPLPGAWSHAAPMRHIPLPRSPPVPQVTPLGLALVNCGVTEGKGGCHTALVQAPLLQAPTCSTQAWPQGALPGDSLPGGGGMDENTSCPDEQGTAQGVSPPRDLQEQEPHSSAGWLLLIFYPLAI